MPTPPNTPTHIYDLLIARCLRSVIVNRRFFSSDAEALTAFVEWDCATDPDAKQTAKYLLSEQGSSDFTRMLAAVRAVLSERPAIPRTDADPMTDAEAMEIVRAAREYEQRRAAQISYAAANARDADRASQRVAEAFDRVLSLAAFYSKESR